jgi:hypothetical protein
MKSSKITSLNASMDPNKMSQKLVTAKDYNLLRDDVSNLISGGAVSTVNVSTINSTTTGINVGTYATPITLVANPGALVIGEAINILHSAGAGDCDDLVGGYWKVAVSGSGDSGLTPVAGAFRAYINAGTASEVYAIQPWAKHIGTGTVTAMSGVSAALVLNDADAFTATNSINAGHFHIKTVAGAANGTVTSGNFDGVMVEMYPNVTGMRSFLNMANDGTTAVTTAIRISGAANVNAAITFDAAATDKCVTANTTSLNGLTPHFAIKILVGTVPYWIPVFSTTGTDGQAFA